MSVYIHPSAIVSPEAKLGVDVQVGPFSIIGPHVEIGDNSIIHSHVVIDGHTKIGKSNQFFQSCSIGAPPQDLTYKGEPTRLEIGDYNIFREFVSIHRGTLKDHELTKIGSKSFIMAYVHFGHDVQLGDDCIIANTCNFAGHVKIGDRVIMGGGCNVSQFVSIGRGSYIGGASTIVKDIPAFCTGYGNRITLKGVNIIGLRRLGYDKSTISEVVSFFRDMETSVLSPRSFVEDQTLMNEYNQNEVILEMVEDIKKSEMGIAGFA